MDILLYAWNTICLMFTLLMTVYSQLLYESSTQWDSEFNRDTDKFVIQSTLHVTETILKNTQSELEVLKANALSVSVSYDELLKMFNKRELPTDETIDSICVKQPKALFGSISDCHQYYNCSGTDSQLSVPPGPSYNYWTIQHKHECHYPFMFSEDTLQCENYTEVSCGRRYKPTWECRYFRLQCKLSHCPACEARYPKCEDKEDGFHIVPEVGLTPRYMICKGGRTIALDSCNGDKIWGVHSFPYNGKCTHMYALPSDFFGIGRLPSCKGKLNGNYQFPDRPCDAYYQCKDGVSSPVKCPNNTVFDSVKQICEEGGKCIV